MQSEKKFSKKRKHITSLLVVVAFIICIAAIAVLTALLLLSRKQYVDATLYAEQVSAEKYAARITELSEALAAAEEEDRLLSTQLTDLQKEKEKIMQSCDDAEKQCAALNMQIDVLHEKIERNHAEIQTLQDNIAMFGKVYSVDLNEQFQILNQLEALLENPPAMEKKQDKLDAEGNPVLDEEGNPVTEIVSVEPHIAVYYEDIYNGYTYSYHADDIFDSASLIKAPFVLAHLQAASGEYLDRQNAQLYALEEGTVYQPPMRELSDGTTTTEPIYDFSRTFVYHADENYQSGSGKIIEAEDGTVFTQKELFWYLLQYSDNVAYYQLNLAYGYLPLRQLAHERGWTSMYGTLSEMSAHDAGKIMIDIYRFTESGAPYADIMKDGMIGSAHKAIIVNAVSPKIVAHKYGWAEGTYHDMAIVYDENPYVISIMTNYDVGGKEVNAYLQEIVSCIDSLHDQFYVKKQTK